MSHSSPKALARRVCRRVLAAVPFPLALRIARLNDRLFNQLPPGHVMKFDKYHGQYSVEIDTAYPIERQMLSGEYDPATAGVMRRFVKAGDCVIDVGANVGAHTLLLAKLVGPRGKVYAFEPGPPLFERLTHNLRLNPVLEGVVIAVRLGLSDASGVLHWNEEAQNRGNAHLRAAEGIRVEVVRLDDYWTAASRARASFIKIDVEGMEYQVLQGARALLMRDRPVVYFETMPGARADIRKRLGYDTFLELEAYFTGLGYELFAVAGKQLRPVTSSGFLSNTLALPRAEASSAAAASFSARNAGPWSH
jgi:FkbM family methyltransferase